MDHQEFNCSWVLGFNCTNFLWNVTEQHSEYITLYEVPVGIVILLSIFYGTISFVAVVGNSLVIWIVATSRRMQNVTNCFIANLALADIVIGLFAIPFQFQAALLQRWNLPHFMCPFCPFVQVVTVNVSVFTLTAIAVDRHRAILNPLSARPSKLRAKISIATIWIVAVVLATPMAIALRVTFVEAESPGGTVIVKPFCQNVIKMLVIVVALFALCWLPLQTYNVLQDLVPGVNEYHYINIIWFCCDWLAMSNSCYNPFIYGIYNEKFKREFQQRFPFRGRKWNQSGVMSGDSMDLDRTFTHNLRSSVHSTSLTTATNAYDWRRGYSTKSTTNHATNGKNLYRQVSVQEPLRSKSGIDKDIYVYRTNNSNVVCHSSDTEFDDLCL